jgi:hypothetical protein
MNKVARAAGLTPEEFRRRNFIVRHVHARRRLHRFGRGLPELGRRR